MVLCVPQTQLWLQEENALSKTRLDLGRRKLSQQMKLTPKEKKRASE